MSGQDWTKSRLSAPMAGPDKSSMYTPLENQPIKQSGMIGRGKLAGFSYDGWTILSLQASHMMTGRFYALARHYSRSRARGLFQGCHESCAYQAHPSGSLDSQLSYFCGALPISNIRRALRILHCHAARLLPPFAGVLMLRHAVSEDVTLDGTGFSSLFRNFD